MEPPPRARMMTSMPGSSLSRPSADAIPGTASGPCTGVGARTISARGQRRAATWQMSWKTAPAGGATEHHAAELGLRVLQGEVEVAGAVAAEVGHLAVDPDVGEPQVALHELLEVAGQPGDSVRFNHPSPP